MKFTPHFFFLTAVMLYGASAEVEAYRKGFEHGLKMFEFQMENEGVSPKKIDVDFQYTVELNTKDLSTTEILYLQYLTARDGYQPMLIKGALLFGKFESLADAKQLSETLKRKYNFDTLTKELKPSDEIYSHPVLLIKAFNKYAKEKRDKGEELELKITPLSSRFSVETPTKVTFDPIKPSFNKEQPKEPKRKAERISQEVKELFKLKHPKTQSYEYIAKANSSVIKSSYFIDGAIFEKEKFKKGKEVTTDKGEKFIKVYDRNLYFAIDDVEFLR